MADWEDHMQWSHAGMYTDEYFHKVIEALCSTGCRKKGGQKKRGGGSWGKFSNLFHKCIIQKSYTHLSFILVYLETRNRTNLHTAFLCFSGKSVTCRSPLKKPLFGKIIFFHLIFFYHFTQECSTKIITSNKYPLLPKPFFTLSASEALVELWILPQYPVHFPLTL